MRIKDFVVFFSVIVTFAIFRTCAAAKSIYALVAAYPTVTDGVTLEELKEACKNKGLALTPKTYDTISHHLSIPQAKITEEKEFVQHIWETGSYGIVSFDELDPRLKVLAIDEKSPFLTNFDPDDYFLAFDADDKNSNYDTTKLTSVILTGTTAMARHLSYHIETDGLFVPVENIADTLRAADITHISNESSFYSDCPAAVPLRREARFCSSPSYFPILEKIGADVIELTGNHNLDWGEEGYMESLEIYKRAGMKVYGGGKDAADASQPVLIEHNGNQIAFVGCNAIGPEKALAGENKPGAAACDREKLKEQVLGLKEKGYQVIVTFQHLEHVWYDVPRLQNYDFYWIAKEASPAVISGSQAHIPQGMTFSNGSFIHFGLGNLLFDQMSDVERTSFFDRHYFYDGRYIGNHLETITLENYSQPRFLTQAEREKFTKMIFDTCEWSGVFGK